MTRECRACDGTPLAVYRRGEHPERPVVSAHYTREEAITSLCAPCSGSGRIEDHIPASDAIADAETLLLARRIPNADLGATVLESVKLGRGVQHGHLIYAARVAFRAVPGLRG